MHQYIKDCISIRNYYCVVYLYCRFLYRHRKAPDALVGLLPAMIPLACSRA